MIAKLWHWHEHPGLIAAAQSAMGRVLIWLCATGLFMWHELTLLMPLAVAAVMWQPQRRRLIVSIAAAAYLLEYFVRRKDAALSTIVTDPGTWLLPTVQFAGVLGGLYLLFWLAYRFASWPALIRRFPVLSLHSSLWVALALAGPVPIFGIATEFGYWLIWRVSYLFQLASRGRIANTSFGDHLMYLWPVFGGNTPYGKGLEYFRQKQVADTGAATQSALSGIKVLILAIAWQAVIEMMDALVLGDGPQGLPPTLALMAPDQGLSLPSVADALAGKDVSLVASWLSIYIELVRATLVIAVRGHVVVGCLRLLGFNIFRNTYKPFLSESIVDFWGRFSFYFKEVMVEFFFYPIFLRCTWAGPRLRLFLAVFAAACFGNVYFHFLLLPDLIAAGDMAGLWQQLGPRSVYCVFLAFGVWVSMLRQQQQRRARTTRTRMGRARAIAGVLTFFAVIHVWNVDSPGASLADRGRFCLSLVGIG